MVEFATAYREAVEKETDIRDTSFLPEVPWNVCGFRLRWITPLDYKILLDAGNHVVYEEPNPPQAHVAAFLWYMLSTGKPSPKNWIRYALARWAFTKKIAGMDYGELASATKQYLADNLQDQLPTPDGDGTKQKLLPVSFLVVMCDAIAKEYGWDDDAIVRKPIARLFQYMKLIMQRLDPKAPTFNPSDAVKNRLMQ